ncbi:MAG: glycosyltransferase family 9 protein, partial [Desulfobacterium sp.]
PTPSKKFQNGDFLFNPKLPVATNLCRGCQTALELSSATKENGIQVPTGKKHKKFPKRIVLHPTSNDPKRNWSSAQFLLLARGLRKEDYQISFSVSPAERPDWLHVLKEGFELPSFANITELAVYLYESGFLIGNDSGIGHLASNLKIPTLTISGNPKRVRLWRPDWYYGQVVTIPFPLPNFKGINLRVRENFWQHFISVPRTLRAFHKLKENVS